MPKDSCINRELGLVRVQCDGSHQIEEIKEKTYCSLSSTASMERSFDPLCLNYFSEDVIRNNEPTNPGREL